MIPDVLFTAVSGNTKTGPLPVTYRTEATCPTTCAFYKNGCYAEGKPFLVARKNARTVTVDEAVDKLGGRRADARFLRDRVSGDVLAADGKVDMPYIRALAEIGERTGLRVFGYTHLWSKFTKRQVKETARRGYVMNASCETRGDVERAVMLGMPAVITSDSVEEGEVIAGLRVVTCPAQTHEGVTCASCGLCARPQRHAVVRFLTHGPRVQKARAAIERREAQENEEVAA